MSSIQRRAGETDAEWDERSARFGTEAILDADCIPPEVRARMAAERIRMLASPEYAEQVAAARAADQQRGMEPR